MVAAGMKGLSGTCASLAVANCRKHYFKLGSTENLLPHQGCLECSFKMATFISSIKIQYLEK